MGDGMPFIPAWFDEMKITQRQYRIACRIARRGDCTESARSIAANCGMSRNAVLQEVENLIKIGLVTRGLDGRGKPCFKLRKPLETGTDECQNGTDECHTANTQMAPTSARGGTDECMGGTDGCQNGTDECTKVLLPEGTPIKVKVPRERTPKKIRPIKLTKSAWGEVFSLDWPKGFRDRNDFVLIFQEWVEFRVKLKKLTQTPGQFFGRQLKKMEPWGVDGAIESIAASLGGEWQGLFPPKSDGKPRPLSQPEPGSTIETGWTGED